MVEQFAAGDSLIDIVEDDDQSDGKCEISDVDENDVKLALKLQEPLGEALPRGFVVANTSKGIKRLNYVGSSGKQPGIHYGNYILWGDEVGNEREYNLRCINCFGREWPLAEVVINRDGAWLESFASSS